jgi:hypothetical protein
VNRSVVTAIVMILGATAGCGRHASRLSGRISLDGKPLTTGVITLTPVGEGPSAYAAIGVDGRYSIHTGAATGLDPGEYVVTVAANASAAAGTVAEAPGNKGLLPLITPPHYGDARKSPLRARVEPGSQELDFELQSR